ncbi:unnamed protein product [Arctogadus glacialis]
MGAKIELTSAVAAAAAAVAGGGGLQSLLKAESLPDEFCGRRRRRRRALSMESKQVRTTREPDLDDVSDGDEGLRPAPAAEGELAGSFNLVKLGVQHLILHDSVTDSMCDFP